MMIYPYINPVNYGENCNTWYNYLINWLTDSMEHSPSEKANSPSDSEEISYTLMEPEYSLPYSQQPTTFSCPETVKPSAQTPNLFPRYIIFPSIPRSSELSFSIRSPNQNPVGASPLPPIRATCPAHLILLDFTTRTILGESTDH